MDPDIRPGIRKKQIKDWKPAFGQICAAQTHLLNKEVEVGDLFLFFGWFRQTAIQNRTLKYKKDAPNIHAIYGYLQIGDIVVGDNIQKYFWHPHTKFTSDNNTLYVSSDNLLDTDLPGAGTLRYSDKLCLTAEGMSRSKWKLPDFFMENKINISYHNANSYKNNYFQSASIGQEFVIAEDERVTEWAKSLICDNYEQI